MGYILGNTRQSRNAGDIFTEKERAGGKGRQFTECGIYVAQSIHESRLI